MRWAKKVLPQLDAERKVAKLLAEKPTGPQGNQVKHELIFQKWREAEAKRGKQRVVSGEQGEAQQKAVGISEVVKEVVRVCLRVEPGERPDIDQLIALVEDVVAALPDEGDAALDME